MDQLNGLKDRVKRIMVENLMLPMVATEIADDQPLFGPGSLGLDSVDALQLVVALDKHFGLKIPNPAAAAPRKNTAAKTKKKPAKRRRMTRKRRGRGATKPNVSI